MTQEQLRIEIGKLPKYRYRIAMLAQQVGLSESYIRTFLKKPHVTLSRGTALLIETELPKVHADILERLELRKNSTQKKPTKTK